jgi:hypothetical protein
MTEHVREYIVSEETLIKTIQKESQGHKTDITCDGIRIEGRTKTVEYKFKNFSENFLQTIKQLKQNGKRD